MSADPEGPSLSVNVFTAPEKAVVGGRPHPFGPPLAWDPTTSTLIFGERDAVLIDPQTTVAEAQAVAAWVELHHRNLETVYITHGHADHYFGLSVIAERFPDVRAIATPQSVDLLAATEEEFRKQFAAMNPGGLPTHIMRPEPYAQDTFTLEGHEIRIIQQGRTDTRDTTSLHVPSIDLVVGGDVVYNECHMYVGDTTAESRQEWIEALDRLAGLKPKIAVAGHKKPGVPDGPEAIAKSKHYVQTYDRLISEGNKGQALYDEMLAVFPDYESPQSWLILDFPPTNTSREH